MLRAWRPLTLSLGIVALSACAGLMPPTHVPATVAPQWLAPLPHQGTVRSLAQWWQQQGDPLLAQLIVSAQGVSPSVAQALSRIEAARAQQAAANATLLPNLSAQASAVRGVTQPALAPATTLQGGLQAAWELDLVGANRAVSQAAQAQLDGTRAQWHDARVSVAAEVARLYYSLATCTQLLAVARQDADSRQHTARLADLSATAGFTAPAVAALARAGAADGKSRVTQQAAQCDLDTKGLVALTGIAEPDLRSKLAVALTQPAQEATIFIASVPAQTIAQRPDVFVAERDVVVASAQVGSAKAQRYPRLSLNGSIGAMRSNGGGAEQRLSTWSFGPLALSLPLFDGGQRAAAVQSAEAAYQSAVAVYQGKVRQAVREVEEALVKLHSTEERTGDAQVATRAYAQALAAAQTRYSQGMASLIELEEARRSALAAESASLSLALERSHAWVALYRALGGGFEADASQ